MTRERPRSLEDLAPWDDDGDLRAVIECPRGSCVKLKYDRALDAMTLKRPLPLGVAFPFDFGFVPGTRAPDGDPLDVLVLLDAPTFPGVVVACRPLGVVRASQAGQGKRRVRNDRLVAIACADERRGHMQDARDCSERERVEIEAFFRAAVALEDKELEILGWGGVGEARRGVRAAAKRWSAQIGAQDRRRSVTHPRPRQRASK